MSTIGADDYLSLRTDHDDGQSSRSSRDEFVDLEIGGALRRSVERDEASIASETGDYTTTFVGHSDESTDQQEMLKMRDYVPS